MFNQIPANTKNGYFLSQTPGMLASIKVLHEYAIQASRCLGYIMRILFNKRRELVLHSMRITEAGADVQKVQAVSATVDKLSR